MSEEKNNAGLTETDSTGKEEVYGIKEINELLGAIEDLFVEINERYEDGTLSANDLYGLLDNVWAVYDEFQDWTEIKNEIEDINWDEGQTVLSKCFIIFKQLFTLINTILDKQKKA